ncbi:hypothetical protein QLL95_gp0339 [Cotonvirus japonicus]|uniref:Uncharacterized protein n=1 Tax=Cotonvirus japonicus TaxID=2811091 RepID=A0ABM7NUC1_9VIRU|nr:hypothetical protein QLL95_gp0339 [Cotonvirus japonicus]BCS83784.1 hypothetical protein [Cotonvirus japonicus]
MKKDEKIKWNKSKKTLINIIKIYHEEYNDKDNEDTFCAQKGDIKQDLTIDNIEKQLDKKIPKYNGFNENHPMNGVTFDKSKNKYQVKFKNINTYGSDLEIISKKILESYVKKTTEIVQIYVKYNFIYQNHYFIVYSIEKQLYFDIQHIISVLNLKNHRGMTNTMNSLNISKSIFGTKMNLMVIYLENLLVENQCSK